MIETLLALVPALVLVAFVVWLINELGKHPSVLRHLAHELRNHPSLGRGLERALRFRLPVYSAETVRGKEAEFIRDRLPIKAGRTLLIMLALLMLALALFWWVTR